MKAEHREVPRTELLNTQCKRPSQAASEVLLQRQHSVNGEERHLESTGQSFPKISSLSKNNLKVSIGTVLSTAFLSHQRVDRAIEQPRLEEDLEGPSGPTLFAYLSPTAGILPLNHSYNRGRRKESCFSQSHQPGFYRPC